LAAEIDNPVAPTFLHSLPIALKAFAFAREAHREQRRESDAAQFIIHPLEVGSLLHNTGHADHVVAAGILHDTIEDSAATAQAIRARFGAEVAEIVEAMSEDPAIPGYEERKAALRRRIAAFGPSACAVYAADKVAKVRELRSRAARGEDVLDPRHESARGRLEHYVASLSMLEQANPQHPLVRQLRFELEILHALPPRPDLLTTDPS
jgi:(p)ppGpp synthase/HD superfamily hydrolase